MATRDELWAMVAAERTELADTLDGLDGGQWSVPSLCAGWTVRDVAAHLVGALGVPMPVLMLRLARYRFDFDRFAFTEARRSPLSGPECVAVLRAHRDTRFAPPGLGPVAPLTDLVAHGQDIRRPLGIARQLPADRARPVLDFLVSPKATRGFVRRGHVPGVTWRCSDLAWAHGDGPVVDGPAEALILALLGRAAVYPELRGTGADVLRSR